MRITHEKIHFQPLFGLPSCETLDPVSPFSLPDLRYSNLMQWPPPAGSRILCPSRAQNGFTFQQHIVVGDAKMRMFSKQNTRKLLREEEN